MEFLRCAKMKLKKCRDTLIDKKNITDEVRYRYYWKDTSAKRMIGLKAFEGSLLKEAH